MVQYTLHAQLHHHLIVFLETRACTNIRVSLVHMSLKCAIKNTFWVQPLFYISKMIAVFGRQNSLGGGGGPASRVQTCC